MNDGHSYIIFYDNTAQVQLFKTIFYSFYVYDLQRTNLSTYDINEESSLSVKEMFLALIRSPDRHDSDKRRL